MLPKRMYWNTVNTQLKLILEHLMNTEIFSTFRLVGGTSLSLQIGHRLSVDIDMFSDAIYDSIDFECIDKFLSDNYPYFYTPNKGPVSMGRAYAIGANKDDCIKLDLYYTDQFIQPAIVSDGIRMATIEEIIAMKIDIVQRGGRKKDFWDIHELIEKYPLSKMIALHKERYPYSHDQDAIKRNFINFEDADNDFDPICLRGKYWELIKLDLMNSVHL
jgi:hypothetical protein